MKVLRFIAVWPGLLIAFDYFVPGLNFPTNISGVLRRVVCAVIGLIVWIAIDNRD